MEKRLKNKMKNLFLNGNESRFKELRSLLHNMHVEFNYNFNSKVAIFYNDY